MSESIVLTLTPERSALLDGIDTQVDILLQVKAPELSEEHQRSSLNLSVVLDRSGSMQGDPLEVAKQCALFVQSRLSSNDLISLVTYDDAVQVPSASSAASPNDHYRGAVERIEVGGTTNLFGGWEAGVKEIAKRSNAYDINRVLLLSDGCLNHGITDPEVIKERCLAAAREGIKTSTYGLGTHFDESVMCMMAEVTGGNNRYGERVEDLLEGFIEELDLLAHLYGSELSIKLEPAPGVEVQCLNSLIERDGELLLPDLACGAEVWAGLRLKVSAAMTRSKEPLLTVKLKAKTTEQVIESSVTLDPLPALSPTASESVAQSDAVTQYFAELKVSDLKLQASQAGQRRDWDLVQELIAQMRQLPMTPVQNAELDELEQLFAMRQAEIFSKEARFSGSRSKRAMKADISSYMLSSNWVGSAQEPSAPSPSYLRKKSRQGRSNQSQRASDQSRGNSNPFTDSKPSKLI